MKVTGLPEAPPVAFSVMGAAPKYIGDAGCGKSIICEIDPTTWIPCTEPVTFWLLSVNSTRPLTGAALVGLKSSARVQLVHPAS
jgi:hypothetical protein